MRNEVLIPVSCLLIMCSAIVRAQNLVTNPGFENYNNCPTDRGQIFFRATYDSFATVTDWINPLLSTSPDYYNTCAGAASGVMVPYNADNGYQEPRSGNAYAGISVFTGRPHKDTADDWREYLETKLAEPLIAGHKYYVSFFMNMTWHLPALYNIIGVDRPGILFLNDIYDTGFAGNSKQFFIPGTPDVGGAANMFITDTLNWTKIHGVYEAKGGEQWMILGKFYDGAPVIFKEIYSPVNSIDSIHCTCYMYVDDVCVVSMDKPGTSDTVIYSSTYPLQINGGLPHGEYQWSNGDTSETTTVKGPGVYWRESFGDCSYYVDTVKVVQQNIKTCLWLPTAFTPNGDGKNDLFGPEDYCNNYFFFYRFSVYDRWGERIYVTDNPYDKWDGKLNGKAQDMGVYFYELLYNTHPSVSNHGTAVKLTPDEVNVIKGCVTLVR